MGTLNSAKDMVFANINNPSNIPSTLFINVCTWKEGKTKVHQLENTFAFHAYTSFFVCLATSFLFDVCFSSIFFFF